MIKMQKPSGVIVYINQQSLKSAQKLGWTEATEAKSGNSRKRSK